MKYYMVFGPAGESLSIKMRNPEDARKNARIFTFEEAKTFCEWYRHKFEQPAAIIEFEYIIDFLQDVNDYVPSIEKIENLPAPERVIEYRIDETVTSGINRIGGQLNVAQKDVEKMIGLILELRKSLCPPIVLQKDGFFKRLTKKIWR